MDEIKGIARVKFHPGKVEEWKRLSEEAMEIVRTRDSGTLQYKSSSTMMRARRWCSSATATPTPRSSTFISTDDTRLVFELAPSHTPRPENAQ